MFDPAVYGYPFNATIDKRSLGRLLNQFEGEVKRESDRKLALELRAQILDSPTPSMTKEAFFRLAKWCKTDGIYGDGMQVARKISEILFGRTVDRSSIGV
jgi:hypothetical protein